MKKIKQITILIPIAEGFEESEAIIVVDLLRRAGVTVIMAGCADLKVKSVRNVTLLCDSMLKDVKLNSIDGIVLPGGQPGTNNLMKNISVRDIIIELDRQNMLVAAICAAPMVLHAAGILSGRKVTSHPSVAQNLDRCVYLEDGVVVDGNIITSRGMGTAIPFGISIIEFLTDKENGQAVAKTILA